MKKKSTFIFLMISLYLNAQVVIGSSIESPVAALKLDASDKAFKAPLLSIQNKKDSLNPVLRPARGLFFYNLTTNILNDVYESPSYWGEKNEYQFLATKDGVTNIIENSDIPLVLLSMTVGRRSSVGCGSGTCSGWQWTKINPIVDEIDLDKFSAWNTQTNEYTVQKTGKYAIKFDIDISNDSNGNGTSSFRISKNNTVLIGVLGRFIPTTNRAYNVGMYIYDLAKGDRLYFDYVYTQNNYRLEKGIITIFQY